MLIYFVNKLHQRMIYWFNYTVEDIIVTVTELVNCDKTDFIIAFEI